MLFVCVSTAKSQAADALPFLPYVIQRVEHLFWFRFSIAEVGFPGSEVVLKTFKNGTWFYAL